jgi:hypothetical protein
MSQLHATRMSSKTKEALNWDSTIRNYERCYEIIYETPLLVIRRAKQWKAYDVEMQGWGEDDGELIG